MNVKEAAKGFRRSARKLQRWTRQAENFAILTTDFDKQRQLQALIRDVDAHANLLQFRFPDVDLRGLGDLELKFWGWCRVPYCLARTGDNGKLVDCYSLQCTAAWSRAIDSLVAGADLLAEQDEGDPWSAPYSTEDWVKHNQHRHFTSKTMESLRAKAGERKRCTGNGRGPWQFRKSFCLENGLKCPDFS